MEVSVRDRFSQLRFATTEVADNVAASLLAPADHLLVGDNCPLLACLSVERMVLSPLLWVRLKALVNGLAVALVPGAVHAREVAVTPLTAIHISCICVWEWHDDLR